MTDLSQVSTDDLQAFLKPKEPDPAKPEGEPQEKPKPVGTASLREIPTDQLKSMLKARASSSRTEGGLGDVQIDTSRGQFRLGDINADPEKIVAQMQGREQDIDYNSGAPWATRVMTAKADNPREVEKTLKRYYQEGDYGRDPGGRWWVKEDGKKVAVDPGTILSNLGVGAQASATPMAGSIAGGALGALGGPAAPFTIPLGIGVGAAAGKGLDEFQKWITGVFDKTPAETVGVLAHEGALNMTLAGAPQALGPAARAIKKGWFGVTEGSSSTGERLMAGGAIPPVGHVGTEASGFEMKRQLRNVVSGDRVRGQNVEYAENELRHHFKSLGMKSDEVEMAMMEVQNSAASIDKTLANEGIVQATQRQIARLEGSVQTEITQARTALDQQEKLLRRWSQEPSNIRPSQELADGIVGRRREFSRSMNNGYTTIHRMGGEAEVVDIGATIQQAQNIVAQYEGMTGAVPVAIRDLARRENPMATIEEAHRARSQLRESANMWNLPNLTPDKSYALMSAVEDTVDEAITAVARSGQGLPAEAARQLRSLDSAYRDGIKVYKDQVVNKLVRDVRSGLVPDAEVAASVVLRSGNVERTRELLNFVTPEVKDEIARADMRTKISRASYIDSDGTTRMDGKQFLKILEKSARTDALVYPRPVLNDLRRLGQEVAAAGGELEVSALTTPTGVRDALQRWQLNRDAMDQFVRENPLAALRSGDPAKVDGALTAITKPGATETTRAAMALLNPDERSAVQVYNLKNLFSSAMEVQPNRTQMVNGAELAKQLRKYPEAQQDLLFPYGMASDLRQLGKDLEFLFPSRALGAGESQTATSVTSKGFLNPFALHKRVTWYVSGFITDQPMVLKWLADIHRRDPEAARMIMPGVGRWIVDSATRGPTNEQIPEPQGPRQSQGPMQPQGPVQ